MGTKVIGGTALDSRKRFPLVASQNGRFLREQDGTPWLICGDSPQPMFVNVSVSDAESYITTRIGQGFNTFMVMLLCADYTFGLASGETYDSIKPFSTGTAPSSYDLSTPNSTYWARMDSMMALADKHGVVFMVDPIETGGWLTCLQNNGTTKAYNYGAFLGARYASYGRIIWESGNDFNSWQTSTDMALVKNVMQGIQSASSQPHTIELGQVGFANNDLSCSLDATSDIGSLISLNGAYTYYPTYDEVLTARGKSPTMPVFLVEANYENEDDTGQSDGVRKVQRFQAYWTMTCGATGSMWASSLAYRVASDGSWSTEMTTNSAADMTQHFKFFHSIAWWNLVPDTSNVVLTSGFGTYTSTKPSPVHSDTYATCAADSLTGGASLAVVFTPVNHGLVIDLSKFRGSVTAQWFDPTNGSYSSISGSPFTNSGSHTFTPSATNNGGDADWVLLLQA